MAAPAVALALVGAGCTGAPDRDRQVRPIGPRCARVAEPAPDLIEATQTVIDPATLEWETAAPADVGLDAELLEAGAENAGLSKTIASMLVIRHGKLVFERYFNGSEASHSNSVASLSKSILSLLTGVAIADGCLELDTPISQILPDELVPRDDGLTVRQLLTMSAGLEWDEGEDSDELDVRATLSRARTSPPGEEFRYNTGLTHVLSAVLTEATGRSTCDYARERLFAPLGVTADYWERRPDGYFAGGDILWLTPREIARFGQLALNGGVWEGRRLVPQEWVEESLSTTWDFGCGAVTNLGSISREAAPGGVGYGYLWWLSEAGDLRIWSAQGFGGQRLLIVPELDLVVVVTQHTWPRPFLEPVPVPGMQLLRWFVMPAVLDAPDAAVADRCPLPDVYRVRADGSEPTQLTDHPAVDIGYSWSPDGTRIAFHSGRDLNGEVYTMAADGADVRRLTRNFAADGFPSWSPDGDAIALSSERGGTFDIYRMDPDGSNPERLTDFGSDDLQPTWSPDGRRIAFIRGEVPPGAAGALWLMNADGSHPRRLLERPVGFPAWSPDGTRIAFHMIVDDASHVGVLDLQSGAVTDLGPGDLPRWSPDSERLAISTPDFAEIEIYNISDRSRATLVEGSVPIWSHDGRWIAFARTEQPPGSE